MSSYPQCRRVCLTTGLILGLSNFAPALWILVMRLFFHRPLTLAQFHQRLTWRASSSVRRPSRQKMTLNTPLPGAKQSRTLPGKTCSTTETSRKDPGGESSRSPPTSEESPRTLPCTCSPFRRTLQRQPVGEKRAREGQGPIKLRLRNTRLTCLLMLRPSSQSLGSSSHTSAPYFCNDNEVKGCQFMTSSIANEKKHYLFGN